MIFDTVDYEFLKLCGISRYIPSGLQKVYDAPYLKRCVIYNLQEHVVIKSRAITKALSSQEEVGTSLQIWVMNFRTMREWI